MSVARGMGQNGGHFYSNITQPVKLDLQFTVASTNANGLGVSSIKSNGYVNNVFMHTTQTPGTGGDSLVNPNPIAGIAMVQFKNNFNKYLGALASIASPTTGSAGGSVTNHNPYIIASLGSTTTAQWVASGVPVGLTPAVGMSFIAIRTGALGGSGTVISPGVSGIEAIEVIGDPNLSLSNSSIAANGGAWFMLQFLKSSDAAPTLTMNSYTPAGSISAGVIAVAAGTAGDAVTNNAGVLNSTGGEDLAVNAQTFTGTPAVLTGSISAPAVSMGVGAPADGSVVNLSVFWDLSSVTIDGL
jgi:hypothetical protein